MINNALNTGIQGIQQGIQGMETSARQIARGGVDGPRGTADDGMGGLLEPMVNLQLYERSVEASAQVVKTADETLGTLLDIRA